MSEVDKMVPSLSAQSGYVNLSEQNIEQDSFYSRFIDAKQEGWKEFRNFKEPTEAEIRALEDTIDIEESQQMFVEDGGTSLGEFRKELGV